jgi:hypothetical protein
MLSDFNLPLNDIFNTKNKIKKYADCGFITNNLDDALNKLNLLKKHPGNKEIILTAFDVHKDGAKNWCFFQKCKVLYNFVCSNKNFPLYEQIEPNKHKLYFDVDLENDNTYFNSFCFNEYKEKIENELINILNNNLKFVWLKSCSFEKHSYHLIVNVSCNNYQNEQIMHYLNEKLGVKCLDNVYSKKRCFRLWNCSKFGQNRPLKIIGKHNFRETLINLYNETIDPINPNIVLKEKLVSTKYNFNYNDWIPVPNNDYLKNNFVQSKYQVNVYVRKNNDTLPCPICKSPKDHNKEKHHKRISCYVFKKQDKTYLGCFRAKQWEGDRYFLNLETNKVEHLPKNENNNISPTIKRAITTFKKALYHDDAKDEIKELLNQTVNFGKYKNQQVKDLFRDSCYVNYIINNFKFGNAKFVLDKLINYFNNDYIEWDYLRFRPKLPTKTITSTSTTTSTRNSKWVNRLWLG